jgi:hypothetical protein
MFRTSWLSEQNAKGTNSAALQDICGSIISERVKTYSSQKRSAIWRPPTGPSLFPDSRLPRPDDARVDPSSSGLVQCLITRHHKTLDLLKRAVSCCPSLGSDLSCFCSNSSIVESRVGGSSYLQFPRLSLTQPITQPGPNDAVIPNDWHPRSTICLRLLSSGVKSDSIGPEELAVAGYLKINVLCQDTGASPFK